FPWMTVRENVAFGLRMTGTGAAERRRIADDWLARVRLADVAGSYPHQLSGGMRQRVAVARAFATRSPALLVAEPPRAPDARPRHPAGGHHRARRPPPLLRDRARPRVLGAARPHLGPAARGRPHRRGDRMSRPETPAATRTATTADDREQRTLVAASAQRARD